MKRIALVALLAALIFCGCGKKDEMKTPEINKIAGATQDEMMEAAKEAGYVVVEDNKIISGGEVMDEFCKNSSEGKPCGVGILVRYLPPDPAAYASAEVYEQEKKKYPMLFRTELYFDGEEYSCKEYNWNADKPDSSGTYKYLKKYDEESTSFDYTEYVLVDDDNVTFQDIMNTMASSILLDHQLRFHILFMNR